MKHTIDTFLASLPPETLKQCVIAIESYSNQYIEMIDNTVHSKIYAIKDVYDTIDELVRDDFKENKISCKKGCAHCCYLCVYVTPDEIATILDHCNRNEIEIDWDRAETQKDLTPETWVKTPQKISRCIFLKDRECSIYPVRPMACRKYHVVTNPKLCDTTTGRHEVAILNNFDVELLVASIHGVRTFDTLSRQLLKTRNG